MRIIIPMAGEGRRFREAGFTMPKPFIPIAGKSMLGWALACLPSDTEVWCIVKYGMVPPKSRSGECPFWPHNVRFLSVPGPTQGAACSVLAALVGLPPDEPVAVMNADQYFTLDKPLCDLEDEALFEKWDGFILTFQADHPKWSYVEADFRGVISRVVEKQVLPGNQATVGFYWFRRARDLLWACADTIARNDRVNGEFYLAPTANGLIRAGARFQAVPVAAMHGLGTPEDVAVFEEVRRRVESPVESNPA